MTVSVHHAGEHEAARPVDHLSGCGPGLQIRADGSDDAICHQDVARWQVAQVRVDGHDVAALYQQFSAHGLSSTSAANGGSISSTVRYGDASRPRPVGAPVIPWRHQGWENSMADVDLRK